MLKAKRPTWLLLYPVSSSLWSWVAGPSSVLLALQSWLLYESARWSLGLGLLSAKPSYTRRETNVLSDTSGSGALEMGYSKYGEQRLPLPRFWRVSGTLSEGLEKALWSWAMLLTWLLQHHRSEVYTLYVGYGVYIGGDWRLERGPGFGETWLNSIHINP